MKKIDLTIFLVLILATVSFSFKLGRANTEFYKKTYEKSLKSSKAKGGHGGEEPAVHIQFQADKGGYGVPNVKARFSTAFQEEEGITFTLVNNDYEKTPETEIKFPTQLPSVKVTFKQILVKGKELNEWYIPYRHISDCEAEYVGGYNYKYQNLKLDIDGQTQPIFVFLRNRYYSFWSFSGGEELSELEMQKVCEKINAKKTEKRASIVQSKKNIIKNSLKASEIEDRIQKRSTNEDIQKNIKDIKNKNMNIEAINEYISEEILKLQGDIEENKDLIATNILKIESKEDTLIELKKPEKTKDSLIKDKENLKKEAFKMIEKLDPKVPDPDGKILVNVMKTNYPLDIAENLHKFHPKIKN